MFIQQMKANVAAQRARAAERGLMDLTRSSGAEVAVMGGSQPKHCRTPARRSHIGLRVKTTLVVVVAVVAAGCSTSSSPSGPSAAAPPPAFTFNYDPGVTADERATIESAATMGRDYFQSKFGETLHMP